MFRGTFDKLINMLFLSSVGWQVTWTEQAGERERDGGRRNVPGLLICATCRRCLQLSIVGTGSGTEQCGIAEC